MFSAPYVNNHVHQSKYYIIKYRYYIIFPGVKFFFFDEYEYGYTFEVLLYCQRLATRLDASGKYELDSNSVVALQIQRRRKKSHFNISLTTTKIISKEEKLQICNDK
jgi:hypothetical protein